MNLDKKSLSFYISLAIFLIAFLASLYLKLFPVMNNNFPFTMDQARDMIDLRSIVELKKPTLIGPTTSINGVFLGPFYYYFNLLPYIISGGDPAFLTYWNLAWYMVAGVLIFWFFYKKDRVFAVISSTIFLMAPSFFYSSRFFWNANPMPYITAFYFISIINYLRRKNIISSSLVGLIAGLAMQVEAAFGVLFLPFFVIFALIRRISFLHILAAIGVFGLTLLPQAIFELRHGFIMTKTFLGEVSGESQILGEKLTLIETFQSHLESFTGFVKGHFQIPGEISIGIFVLSILYLSYLAIKKKIDKENLNLYLATSLFVLFAFGFYMFYHYPLKGWYLLGLHVAYIFITALALKEFYSLKLNFSLNKIAVVVFLLWVFVSSFITQNNFVPKNMDDRSGDKSNLRNELEVIDWVYNTARGRGFKAYNYIPSVYDFPYQYLYWWHGGREYKYHPETITYLDNVPEYIQDNDKFLTLKKPQEGSLIFLIYEPDENQERLAAWLGNFTQYCTIEKEKFNFETTAEMREKCTKE